MSYVAGFVAPVPAANQDAYVKHALEAAPYFKKVGVTRMMEAWGDDVPTGKVTDFPRSVDAKAGESVVFAWQEYPSKDAFDAAERHMSTEPAMQAMSETMPFDGKRMIWGGFDVRIDAKKHGAGPATYVDGALLPVPAKNEEAYLAHAKKQTALLLELGALRVVDAWGVHLPPGKVTDFLRAVKVEGDETVVFSWIEWPSKAVRDAAWEKFFQSDAGQDDAGLYDATRRVWGGFRPVVDA